MFDEMVARHLGAELLSEMFLPFGGVGLEHHFLLFLLPALHVGLGARVAEQVLGEVSHLMFKRLSLLCCTNPGARLGGLTGVHSRLV